MKTFIVTICESIGKDIKVQAENKDEAIEAVRQCYEEDQVVKERFIDSTYVDCEEIKDE
jgi:mannitol/fructose-specific phosphotransferase system IIA component